MIEVTKKEKENVGPFVFRFNKRVKQSGVQKEARKRRYTKRTQNRNKRRASALYRIKKRGTLEYAKKYGNEPTKKTGRKST